MTDSLYGRLKELENSDFYPFHMPGHKRNIAPRNNTPCNITPHSNTPHNNILPAWYSMDITEIDGFDNLHYPQDILLHSQKKAADLYRADETWFLVGGSTAGVLSAFSAVAAKDKKVLIARNSHLSVYHGAYLNDSPLIYLYPPLHNEAGVAAGITADDVTAALDGKIDIGAVLITSPTYEGMVSDIRGIAEAVHRHGLPLIVDQAHGAHFGFHPDFPENALTQGADLVIHGLHKTMPAPTQTALLHVKGARIDRERLKRYLRIYQSSSPSYPLMAGIDCCLDIMGETGRRGLEYLLELRNDFAQKIEHLHFLRLMKDNDDPAKVIILTAGISGDTLAGILRKRYHLEMEMASKHYIIAIFSMMDKPEGINRLALALGEIDETIARSAGTVYSRDMNGIAEKDRAESGVAEIGSDIAVRDKNYSMINYQRYPLETVTSIKTAWDEKSEMVLLAEAAGRIAAEFIFLYPPGIPIAVPGERLDSGLIRMIEGSRREGYHIQGVSSEGVIKVFDG